MNAPNGTMSVITNPEWIGEFIGYLFLWLLVRTEREIRCQLIYHAPRALG